MQEEGREKEAMEPKGTRPAAIPEEGKVRLNDNKAKRRNTTKCKRGRSFVETECDILLQGAIREAFSRAFTGQMILSSEFGHIGQV